MLAFLDYDGTLTTHECNEIVLQRFVGDAWRPLEAEAQADRMSHAECFDRQIGLIRAPRAELLGALVAEAEPAPGLAAFLAELEARGGRPVVVSAGLREAIAAVLEPRAAAARRAATPASSSAAARTAARRTTSRSATCSATARAAGQAACKGAVLRGLRRPGELVLVFGDGASDLCPAREADLTFARGHLAERCADEGLEWRALADFTTVWAEVDAWMARR